MNNVIERKWCTKGTVYIEDLTGMAFTGEDGGHTFVISGMNPDGTSVTLAGTVAGAYILPDGSTQPLTGSIADGKAQITLDPECYALPGRGQLTIFLMASGQKVAIYGAVLNVARSSTAQVPPAITADVADLVQDIEEARASIPASYTNLMIGLAKNYEDLTFPIKAGAYAWHAGTLYKAKTDISAAESWTAAHWETVHAASDLAANVSQLKSAFSESGNDLLDNKIFTITHNGSAFNGIGDVIDITAPTAIEGWNSYVIPCSAQDVFVVWAKGGTTTYAWAFINASGNILARSAGSATVNGLKITAPENTQYLVVCDKGGNSRVYKGELYKNRIQRDFTEVYNTIKTNSKNCLFYVGGGAKVTWSGYNESPITLSLGTNNYAIIIDNAYYNILLSDIITAAISAGITVDQSNKKLTSTGFLLYFDVETHTPKAIDSMTSQAARTAISNNPVLFAAHYKSFRGGLLVDYMYEHRIETVENGVDALDVEVEAIKAVSSDVVPSYFESNLSTKIPEIIDNMNSAGQNGTTFVFITDLHWETNYKNSPALVKRVLDKTSVKNVFCGGDIINQGEKAEMSEVFLDCINRFRFVPNLGFFPIARGNHDDNSNWSSSADIAAHSFDDNTIYNLFYSQFADKVTRIGSNWAFYFDQEVIKTRYIFVDTKRNGLIIDVDAIINCLSSVENGWHVIILMHFTLRNATTLFDGCDLLAHIVKAYNSKENGSYTGSYQTATYDFTNAVGKVDLIIGGHMHADYAMNADDTNNPSGVPIIATDTDSYRNSASIEGTVDSQCFDVVTVNYSAKTVKCVRIGRGVDRTFTY